MLFNGEAMGKWTIIGLGILALFIGLCLAFRGIAYIILIGGFATVAYLISVRKVKHSFLGFLARYGTVLLAFLFVEAALLTFFPALHTTLRNLAAAMVGAVLNLGGAEYSVSGPIIRLPSPALAYDISVGCLGGALFWIYIALVLATPGATSRQRLTGTFAGLAILFSFNLFRITLSIYLEQATGVYVHGYFYLFNMVFVLLVWAGWLWTLKPRRPHLSRAKA